MFAEKRFPIPPTRNLFLKVGIDQFGLGTFLTLVAFHYNECKFLIGLDILLERMFSIEWSHNERRSKQD